VTPVFVGPCQFEARDARQRCFNEKRDITVIRRFVDVVKVFAENLLVVGESLYDISLRTCRDEDSEIDGNIGSHPGQYFEKNFARSFLGALIQSIDDNDNGSDGG
jgi:hypothetical protein